MQTGSTGGSAAVCRATCLATWSARSRWTTSGWRGSCSRTTSATAGEDSNGSAGGTSTLGQGRVNSLETTIAGFKSSKCI